MNDCAEYLCDAVRDARDRKVRVSIAGLGSRTALTGGASGELLSVSEHRGIIEHAPEELVVTARAGTPVRELTDELARAGQQLACEPTRFDRDGSIGGLVACNASGPSRPFTGAVRDAVLGVELVNGLGERCRFGGQVMKNVAGYDIARLQAGAQGQFGIVLSVSLRLIPASQRTVCRELEADRADALGMMAYLRRKVPVLTGLAWSDDRLRVRLEGTEAGVNAAAAELGGQASDAGFWSALAEHHAASIATSMRGSMGAWRLSTDPLQPLTGDELLVDWAGGVRWFDGAVELGELNVTSGSYARRIGGRRAGEVVGLDPSLAGLRQRLQAAFDPHAVFRSGEVA